MKLYQELARLIGVRFRSELGGTGPKGTAERIEYLMAKHFPRDGLNATRIHEDSHAEKLAFLAMRYAGDGANLTVHMVTVTPSLQPPGYRLRITGRNINGVKKKIHDAFTNALEGEVKA